MFTKKAAKKKGPQENRNRFLLLCLSGTVLGSTLLASPGIALADKKDNRIKALEEQLRVITQEIENLKVENRAEKKEIAKVKEQTLKLTNSHSSVHTSASGEQTKITMKPSPKFQQGDFVFQPFGRIHLDYAFFDDDAVDHPNGAEFRRARLGAKGKVSKDIGYKLEIDFGNEGTNFRDVFVNYTGFESVELRAGHFKAFQGMDNLTSANNITFLERAAATSAFTVSEITGIGGLANGDRWSLQAGVFNADAGTTSADDEAFALFGRAGGALHDTETTTLHIGGSASWRKPDQATDVFDFDSTAENSVQTVDSVSANFTNAEDAYVYGLEAGISSGPLHAQGEYFMVDVDREPGNTSLDFTGSYGQIGYVLTGEHRKYNVKKGVFGGIKPKKPFSLKDKNWGAWEVGFRYSDIDVSDSNVLGGEMQNYTLGLNWYLNNYSRLMANYINVDTDVNAVTANDDPDILLLRSQITF